MTLTLFGPKIKKTDVAEFCQKMSMLIETGYDACSACILLAYKPEGRKHDKSADGIRAVANLLVGDLKEGFKLFEAMSSHPKYFGPYINQVEVGEMSGKTGEVLLRIYEQVKNAGNVMAKLRSALTYPVIVLVLTFAVAAYLFTNVVPDMLKMVADVGVTELPKTTQIVMSVGDFMKSRGLIIGTILLLAIAGVVVYSKTIGKKTMARFATKIPLIGQVVENNAITLYFKNWQQMVLAGAEMSISLKSAAEAVPNLYIRDELLRAQRDYEENGVQCYEALRHAPFMRELELQTIQVAIEGDKLAKTLGILADDREFEANRSVNAMTAAINPIMMIVVGAIVGVLVLSIYQPIISVSSSLNTAR